MRGLKRTPRHLTTGVHALSAEPGCKHNAVGERNNMHMLLELIGIGLVIMLAISLAQIALTVVIGGVVLAISAPLAIVKHFRK